MPYLNTENLHIEDRVQIALMYMSESERAEMTEFLRMIAQNGPYGLPGVKRFPSEPNAYMIKASPQLNVIFRVDPAPLLATQSSVVVIEDIVADSVLGLFRESRAS